MRGEGKADEGNFIQEKQVIKSGKAKAENL